MDEEHRDSLRKVKGLKENLTMETKTASLTRRQGRRQQSTVGTRIKVIPSFGKGTLPTLVFKVGGPQGYPSDLSPGVS